MSLREQLVAEANKTLDAAPINLGEIGQQNHVAVMSKMHDIHDRARRAGLIDDHSKTRESNPKWAQIDTDRGAKRTSTLEALQILGGSELANKLSTFKSASRIERKLQEVLRQLNQHGQNPPPEVG
jgi:hypothetical protein